MAKICIVEDEQDLAQALKLALEQDSHEVVLLESGEQVLMYLQQQTADYYYSTCLPVQFMEFMY